MVIEKLTRFPGGGIPGDALTGNATLDGYLSSLDGQLLGSARVRLRTLAAVRDRLRTSLAGFIEAGCEETDAARKAVQSAGSPDELARTQRKALKKKFLSKALRVGILFGLAMGVIGPAGAGLKSLGTVALVLYGLVNGVFFGLLFGWFTTFVWPQYVPSPAGKADAGPQPQDAFTVCYGKTMVLASYFMTVFFALAGGGYALLGIAILLNSPVRISLPYTWHVPLILGVIGILDFYFARLVSRKYTVNEKGVVIEQFLGGRRVLIWDDLKAAGLLGDIRPWLPQYWKTVRYADFQSGEGRRFRMLVYPDMANAGNLMKLLEMKAPTPGTR